MTAQDLAAATTAPGPQSAPPAPWWQSPFRTFQTNLREIDAGLDVEAVLDAIQDHGADTWLLSVGGILANHPSHLTSQTVNPHLAQRPSGDLVGDATLAARARGIRVLARMDFSKIDAVRAERHPEWCFVSPAGEPQIYNGYRSVCPSGEYYQREMFDIVAEVLEKYPVSGFFFNWMSFNEVDYSRRYWGVCHCEACRRGFARAAPGIDLPQTPEDPGYPRWKQYSDAVLADLHQRMQEHVHSLASEAALIQGGRADITFHEANNAVGRELWHQATADAVDGARSHDPARPVFVNAVAFVDMPYRWAGEDARHLEQYAVQTIAHGANPSTYIMGTPADSPFPGLAASRRITRFHRDHQQDYTGLVPTARTALVRPAAAGLGRAEYEGWHTALSEAHVPAVAVHPASLATLDRERFDLVVLPDLGALPEQSVQGLRRFVEGGGAVITTGSSTWSDGSHQLDPRSERLAQRAVFETEESLRSLHIDIGPTSDDPGGGSMRAEGAGLVHVPALGGFRAVEVLAPAPGGEPGPTTGWPVLGRALYGPPEQCYGNRPTGHQGRVTWRENGGGAVTVVPWSAGRALREVGLSAVVDALAALVVDTAGEHLRWRTALPAHVRIVPGRSARGGLVHLLNRSGERAQRFTDPVRTAPAALQIPCPERPQHVRALVADQSLEWSWAEGTLQLATPAIDVFEVITIRR